MIELLLLQTFKVVLSYYEHVKCRFPFIIGLLLIESKFVLFVLLGKHYDVVYMKDGKLTSPWQNKVKATKRAAGA